MANQVLIPFEYPTPDLIREIERCAQEIRTIPKFCVDDVATMYAEHDKEIWDMALDIPNMAPLFPMFWVEWNEPTVWKMDNEIQTSQQGAQAGMFVKSHDLKTMSPERRQTFVDRFFAPDPAVIAVFDTGLREARWVLECSLWTSSNIRPILGRPICAGVTHTVLVRENGSVINNVIGSHDPMTAITGPSEVMLVSPLHILGLAISFTHCKNVRVVETPDDRGEKWHRRTNTPVLKFHTIDINPMKQTLRTEGRSDETGIKKALHICRGHFVTYTPEHPLFGKYVGTFWKPDHVRGNAKNGIVLKDYKVSLES